MSSESPTPQGAEAAASAAGPSPADSRREVDLEHVKPEMVLQAVGDRAHEVVGDLADAGPVLGDDVQLDHQTTVPDLDLDAAVDGLTIEPLGDPIAQAPGGHAHDAVALVGRMADDRGHHPR